MYYNLTVGSFHKRIYKKAFFTSFNYDEFNLDLIKDTLKNDQIDISNIDNYFYYDYDNNGYKKIEESKNYKKPSKGEFKLELHCKINNPILYEFDTHINELKSKYKNTLKKIEEIKKLKENEDKYDLIFLYASPIKQNEEEEFNSINYRLEMKEIQKVMIKSKKEFKCLFECANEKIFRTSLKKPTKILHISSHGRLDKKDSNKYYLLLEENGYRKEISQKDLENIIRANAQKIKDIDLVFLSTCYSQNLGELFFNNGVKNVIYIHGMTPISMLTSIKFTEYFYEELIKTGDIKISFINAKERTKFNRAIIMAKENRDCNKHAHTIKCKLKEINKDEESKNIFINNKICNCNFYFYEFNIHLRDCPFIQKLISNVILKKNLTYKIYKERFIKICCCDYNDSLKDYIPLKDNNTNMGPINNIDDDNENVEENKNEVPHCEFGKFKLLSREKKKLY